MKPEILFDHSVTKLPTLDELLAIKTSDQAETEFTLEDTHKEKTVRNTIIIPPWLLRAIILDGASSCDQIFVAVKNAAVSKDIFEESQKPPPSEKDTSITDTKSNANAKAVENLLVHLFIWCQ